MKLLFVTLLVLTSLLMSCDRYIDSRDPVRSLPNASTAPTDVRLEVQNEAVTISWSLPGSVTAQQFRVYASENDTLSFIAIDSTTTTSTTLTGLKSNVFYFFKIAPVYGGIEGTFSEIISTRFGVLLMVLSNENEYTNSRFVQAQFSTPVTATYVQISEDDSFTDAPLLPFAATRNFQLSDGDGLKTVYAIFKFVDGSESVVPVSDEIILDTRARIDSVYFLPVDDVFEPGDTIRFYIDAGEPSGNGSVSFDGAGSIQCYDDGMGYDVVADDGIYTGWYVVPNDFNLFDGAVTGTFTDRAGNRAANMTAFSTININTLPESVSLVVTHTPGDSARFNWTESSESDFESYRLYRNNSVSVQTSDDLIRYETAISGQYFAVMPPSGTSYYRVFVFDEQGASQGSNTVIVNNP